ncbi:hypothetical protein Clacol_005505 [Clathrus columnatus]|uniref:pyruvate carboxylase n=1 Tax=Clathrus columnatus TaxID=1419009 RepID=A0AAV5ADS4_9AGAM|nr:hypothetical protein Clacol_005505 [Clathrus columnatus]
MTSPGREDRDQGASRGDYVAIPLTEDVEFQRKKAVNGHPLPPSLDTLSNSAIPPVVSYCVASITMTVVNKAYGEVLWFGGRVTGLTLISFMLMVVSSIIAAWSDISRTLTAYSIWPSEAGLGTDTPVHPIVVINSGYVWMLTNCLAQAAYVLAMRKRIKGIGFKDWDTMFYNNLLSIPVLIIFSLIIEDWGTENLTKNFPPETRNVLLFAIAFSGAAAAFISYSTAWCVRTTSSTTYSMVGALNKLPVAASGLLFFGDPVTFGSVSAIAVGFLAGLVYAIAKNSQNKIEKRTDVTPRRIPAPVNAERVTTFNSENTDSHLLTRASPWKLTLKLSCATMTSSLLPIFPLTPDDRSPTSSPLHSIHAIRRKAAGHFGPLTKVLVANRGADEAYQVGKGLTPVGAYLAQDDIIRIALDHGVDMIHPGYGFLSENAEFARKVENAGISFVGPPPEVIDSLGDKTKARTIAMKVGVPVVPGTPGPVASYLEGAEFVKEYGFPVIIKAAMGGGGRGMRVVKNQGDFQDAFERAVSEAKSAFGDGTVFIERFLERPRHIEVQILADADGNTIHLFERDCSVQRRHQKVVEVAPATHLPDTVRQAILGDAIKLAKSVGYRNAGTAEFLVDQSGHHYFIEINPRIQVEHTITEEITGIDIVAAQIQIAAGATLPQLGLTQDAITKRGFAIQCRVTTEDPAQNFQPDTGKIEVYRSAGGNGVRLDASSGFAGARITPYYDSLLVKVSVSGATYEVARRKMLRALIEFRIRGVKFIDDTSELFNLILSQNRAQKLLAYLGDLAVNGSSVKGQQGEPGLKDEIIIPQLPNRDNPDGPPLDCSVPCATGWRNILLERGPEGFAKAVREYPGTLIMDTTWRDAHQSLLATRLRTIDMANIAKETSHALANAYSLECWGGATFDVAMRFLYEDPWERLRTLRKLVPNIPFQALVRGANAVGYTSYPDNAIYDFSKKAVENGLDIFRVFDSLNYIAKKAGGVVEAVVCYSGDVANPKKTKYTLKYYLDFVDQLVKEGIHILCIKDMAGLLKPQAATMLIGAIREKYPDLPIHVHSHDTAGIAAASMIAAALAGADIVDVAIDSMSGLTSQPSMGAVCMALEQTKLGTGIRYEDIQALNLYWTQVRQLYSCFEANVRASDSSVFEHEMPGGQYTNLMFQASQLGLGKQWAEIKKKYIEANQLCGDVIKVTPSSKVVGDFAQWMTSNNFSKQDVLDRAETLDFPSSVVEFFQGYLGQPVGGFPEPLRSRVIRNKPRIDGRPGVTLPPLDFEQIKTDLRAKFGEHITDLDVTSYAMYSKVFEEYQAFIQKYGDLSILPTRYFLGKPKTEEEMHISIEKGKTLIIRLLAIGPVIEGKGIRDVWFEVNGEVRAVPVEDKSAAVETVTRERATSDAGSVGAPMSGMVVEVRVTEGHEIKRGDIICILSAMKMESAVSAPVSGHVKRVLVQEGDSINQGDLIVEIAPPKAKGGKMLSLINWRLKVTLNDGRYLTGHMLAFDRHMNLVLADCEEFRRVRPKKKAGEAEAGPPQDMKRTLGLVILRGEAVVSLSVEGPPPIILPGPGRGLPAGRGIGMMPPALAGRPMPYGPPGMPGMPPPGFRPPGMPPGMPFPPPPPGFGFQPPPQ